MQNVEAQVIRVPTGAQDYYPAMYGGVSAIEFRSGGNCRARVCLSMPAELNRRFVLAYTGAPRHSGINNWEVTKAHINGDKSIQRNFDRLAGIAIAMRKAVERNDWDEAARADARRMDGAPEERPRHHNTADRSAGLRGATSGQHGRESVWRGRRRMRCVPDNAGCEGEGGKRCRSPREPWCWPQKSRGGECGLAWQRCVD